MNIRPNAMHWMAEEKCWERETKYVLFRPIIWHNSLSYLWLRNRKLTFGQLFFHRPVFPSVLWFCCSVAGGWPSSSSVLSLKYFLRRRCCFPLFYYGVLFIEYLPTLFNLKSLNRQWPYNCCTGQSVSTSLKNCYERIHSTTHSWYTLVQLQKNSIDDLNNSMIDWSLYHWTDRFKLFVPVSVSQWSGVFQHFLFLFSN